MKDEPAARRARAEPESALPACVLAVSSGVAVRASDLLAELGDGFALAAVAQGADIVLLGLAELDGNHPNPPAFTIVVAPPGGGAGEAVRVLDRGADAYIAGSDCREVAAHVRALARRLPGAGPCGADPSSG